MTKKIVLSLIAAAMSTATYASNVASDNASNATYNGLGNFNGLNGGSGFGAWVVTADSVGNNTAFVGDSTTNGSGSSGGINTTGNKAWGLFANNNNTESAVRPFTGGGLSIGQTFTVSMDNGFQQAGSAVGFGLQNSAGTNGFEFFFSGGSSNYTIAANSVLPTSTTAHGFTADGLTAALTLTTATTFTLQLTWNSGTPTTEAFTGSLENGVTSLDQFRFFNFNAGGASNNDAYINSMSIGTIPEPSTLSLLAGPAGLGALFFIRRRRA